MINQSYVGDILARIVLRSAQDEMDKDRRWHHFRGVIRNRPEHQPVALLADPWDVSLLAEVPCRADQSPLDRIGLNEEASQGQERPSQVLIPEDVQKSCRVRVCVVGHVRTFADNCAQSCYASALSRPVSIIVHPSLVRSLY